MDLWRVFAGAAICLTLFLFGTSHAEEIKKKPRVARLQPPAQLQRQARRAIVHGRLVAKLRASRDGLRRLLSEDEQKLARETAEYRTKSSDRRARNISKAEVNQSGLRVAQTRAEIQRVRQWISEDDTALASASPKTHWRRGVAVTDPNGYFLRGAFIRYNGESQWSLDDAASIGKFFLEHFGHPMPVSAMGQTPTHDRMGLDHREALDVAVRPDSAEGRGLMTYLRAMGIPFTAFRGKIPGMATGAHIHIGRPSLKMIHVKTISEPENPAENAG